MHDIQKGLLNNENVDGGMSQILENPLNLLAAQPIIFPDHPMSTQLTAVQIPEKKVLSLSNGLGSEYQQIDDSRLYVPGSFSKPSTNIGGVDMTRSPVNDFISMGGEMLTPYSISKLDRSKQHNNLTNETIIYDLTKQTSSLYGNEPLKEELQYYPHLTRGSNSSLSPYHTSSTSALPTTSGMITTQSKPSTSIRPDVLQEPFYEKVNFSQTQNEGKQFLCQIWKQNKVLWHDEERRSKLSRIDEVFDTFVPAMRKTVISNEFVIKLVNLHKHHNQHKLKLFQGNTKFSSESSPEDGTEYNSTSGDNFAKILGKHDLLEHMNSLKNSFAFFAYQEKMFKTISQEDQTELLNRNGLMFVMVSLES
jgi:hypothetical protein